MISVAHIITGLDVGGAERALCHVAGGLRERGLQQLVVSLQPRGPMAAEVERAGVRVHDVGMHPQAPLRSGGPGLARLVSLLRRARPDVVQTWMYHADLLGGLAARAAGTDAVAWNVRHADLPLEGYGRRTAVLARLGVAASRFVPRVIVTNSAAASKAHVARGYPSDRLRLVPNGAATPDGVRTREAARMALDLPPDALVVGRVGRFHEQKDVPTLLAATRTVTEHVPRTRLALIGAGMTWDNALLASWVRDLGLEGVVHLCGPRADAGTLPPAFDLAVSSSAYGETCPNAILEAMAAGVPVATTDVGDSARIVGDTGMVVPPRAPDALAAAMVRMLAQPPDERARLGAAARSRVATRFSLSAMIDGYEAVYRELATRPHGRRS